MPRDIVDDAIVAATNRVGAHHDAGTGIHHGEHRPSAAATDEETVVGAVQGEARGLVASLHLPLCGLAPFGYVHACDRIAVALRDEQVAAAIHYGAIELRTLHREPAGHRAALGVEKCDGFAVAHHDDELPRHGIVDRRVSVLGHLDARDRLQRGQTERRHAAVFVCGVAAI